MSLHNGDLYNEEYFEDGIRSGVSGYENYRWMPTRSFSEAIEICKEFEFNSVVDYGCAKGYLVNALRYLGKDAIGLDISKYAIEKCHESVKGYLHHIDRLEQIGEYSCDLLIAKDIMEHISETEIPLLLKEFRGICKVCFFVIPLGDDNEFRIREYELDKTHVTKKDEMWWIDIITKAGFKLKRFDYQFGGVKEKWTTVEENKYGNGFFVFESLG